MEYPEIPKGLRKKIESKNGTFVYDAVTREYRGLTLGDYIHRGDFIRPPEGHPLHGKVACILGPLSPEEIAVMQEAAAYGVGPVPER